MGPASAIYIQIWHGRKPADMVDTLEVEGRGSTGDRENGATTQETKQGTSQETD